MMALLSIFLEWLLRGILREQTELGDANRRSNNVHTKATRPPLKLKFAGRTK